MTLIDGLILAAWACALGAWFVYCWGTWTSAEEQMEALRREERQRLERIMQASPPAPPAPGPDRTRVS